MRVPFARPWITPEDRAAVDEALLSGWLSRGPKVGEFEEALAAYLQLPDDQVVIATNSCTAALEVGLAAVCGPRLDERMAVIVPALTFPAAPNVVARMGGKVVLADVDPVTLMMTEATWEHARRRAEAQGLTVVATMPTHLYGALSDTSWLTRQGHPVVEDAAHAFGAAWRHDGRPYGAVRNDRHAVAFSFHAIKNLTTGEGGALVVRRDVAERIRPYVLQGMTPGAWARYEGGAAKAHYDVSMVGAKLNMADPAAALGLSQLARFPEGQRRRLHLAARYFDAIGDRGLWDLLEEPWTGIDFGVEHAWHLFVVRLWSDRLDVTRDRVIDELAERGVGANVHFDVLTRHSDAPRRWWSPADVPVAEAEGDRILSLPIYPTMTDDDIDFVVAQLADVLTRYDRGALASLR